MNSDFDIEDLIALAQEVSEEVSSELKEQPIIEATSVTPKKTRKVKEKVIKEQPVSIESLEERQRIIMEKLQELELLAETNDPSLVDMISLEVLEEREKQYLKSSLAN